MPIIVTKGAASTSAYGGIGGGRGVVLAPTTAVTLAVANGANGTSGTSTVTNPYPGYSAQIRFILVGDAYAAGLSCCGNCSTPGSAEYAQFIYNALGTETSFQVAWNEAGTNSANNTTRMTIVGGANNGSSITVGSIPTDCGYGDGGPPTSKSGSVSAAFTREAFGGYGRGSGLYYGDGYYYSPCAYSYGNGSNGYGGYGVAGPCGGGIGGRGTAGALFYQFLNNY